MLTGGLVALALVLGAAWVVATRTGSPGPDPEFLAWHGVVALVAVGAQVRADRAPGRGATSVVVIVVLISMLVLAALWFG